MSMITNDKNHILNKLNAACLSPWKSSELELPEYGKLVLAAYYTGEGSFFNYNKGYKIYLAILHQNNKQTSTFDKEKTQTCWYIVKPSDDTVNYALNYNIIQKMPAFAVKLEDEDNAENIINENVNTAKCILNSRIAKNKKCNSDNEKIITLPSSLALCKKKLDTTPAFWMYVPQIF